MNDKENVEEAEETTAALAEDDFNASKFIDDDKLAPADESEVESKDESDKEESEIESKDESKDVTDEDDNDQDSKDDATDWEEIEDSEEQSEESSEDEPKSESEEESEENESGTSEEEGWESIAEVLDIKADDYNTFIDTLKNQQQLAQKGATNQKVEGLNQLIRLDDEPLMRAELKAKGFDDDEIEDEIDIMIENNTVRSKARAVRKDLESAVQREIEAQTNQAQQADATQQQEIEDARRELEDYMSKTKEIFGGRISTQQKSQHVDYISSGDFFEEVTDSPESIAQAAWLWKYRNQILKAMKSNGFEKGKAAVLDKMTNPEPVRRSNIPDPETGEFNPTRFNDTETM